MPSELSIPPDLLTVDSMIRIARETRSTISITKWHEAFVVPSSSAGRQVSGKRIKERHRLEDGMFDSQRALLRMQVNVLQQRVAADQHELDLLSGSCIPPFAWQHHSSAKLRHLAMPLSRPVLSRGAAAIGAWRHCHGTMTRCHSTPASTSTSSTSSILD